ncbi:glycosyltransferase family 9 protein [Planotetraspora phitsanulokensis]|uniref:LPS biosynthesis-related glycosyltransferase n=1 Tax=Planotetraspora phitsanulokensis TaxID=575192 RepID=A0A8J3XFT5_9ACTN|nr:glycosyltransferase family 9 protein [Planotetraspora phitsanulokensis]GII40057.1 LPS biosynthesis-related glycosyltransferase [Planotetraspora phitsanulokensis]
MTGLLVDGVERIAVLRAGVMADLLIALPAFEALKSAYPAAAITLLGREWHERFLRNRPGPVDEVVPLPPISGVSSAAGGAVPDEVYDDLRSRRFDVVVQMHGGGRDCNPFVRRLGARLTAGLCAPGAEPLDRWIPYVDHQHEILRSLEVAGLLGAGTADVEPRLSVIREDWAELNRHLGRLPKGLVAIHPGAPDPRRRWPPECFAEVADRLGRPVVVTGTEPDRGVVDRVTAAMKRPGLVVIDDLSVGGLAALYAACDLVVSNDSGPRQLAAATGTPTVGIFWCGDLISRGPLSRGMHRPLISWTVHCSGCGGAGSLGCGHESASWVADVTVDDVLEQAQDLLR